MFQESFVNEPPQKTHERPSFSRKMSSVAHLNTRANSRANSTLGDLGDRRLPKSSPRASRSSSGLRAEARELFLADRVERRDAVRELDAHVVNARLDWDHETQAFEQ